MLKAFHTLYYVLLSLTILFISPSIFENKIHVIFYNIQQKVLTFPEHKNFCTYYKCIITETYHCAIEVTSKRVLLEADLFIIIQIIYFKKCV